jgi:hypothetical protein
MAPLLQVYTPKHVSLAWQQNTFRNWPLGNAIFGQYHGWAGLQLCNIIIGQYHGLGNTMVGKYHNWAIYQLGNIAIGQYCAGQYHNWAKHM